MHGMALERLSGLHSTSSVPGQHITGIHCCNMGWDSGPDYEYRDCMASPALGNGRIWWWDDREIISQLPALCEGNPPVIGGFPSQFTTGGFPWQRARYALPDLGNTGTWWQNHMEMISTLLALCVEESTSHRWIPLTKGQQCSQSSR